MKFSGALLNDRWRLGPRMGAGSQARTYLARDEAAPGERIVVVKQFRLDRHGGSWKNFDLFEREVRVLKNLDHPGVPHFIDSFESDPGVFNLVIERMTGATLRAIATKAHFTDADLRDILAGVLEILDYIHNRTPPVIHRDIKPANLVRDARGRIALVDFGGVRDALRQGGGSTIVGTFGYMAPEQLHGQATPATDIYGLGATIVALARGVEPENVPRKGLRMDLQKHLAGRDPELVSVLAAMTEPDPDDRPQSAREAIKLIGGRGAAMVRPGRALAGTADESPDERYLDEVSDMLAAVPGPLHGVLRVFLLVFAVTGYVGVAVLQAVLLPVVFGLVSAFARDEQRPRIAEVRRGIDNALTEGKDGFRDLQKRWQKRGLPGPKDRKRLAK